MFLDGLKEAETNEFQCYPRQYSHVCLEKNLFDLCYRLPEKLQAYRVLHICQTFQALLRVFRANTNQIQMHEDDRCQDRLKIAS